MPTIEEDANDVWLHEIDFADDGDEAVMEFDAEFDSVASCSYDDPEDVEYSSIASCHFAGIRVNGDKLYDREWCLAVFGKDRIAKWEDLTADRYS